MTTGTVFPEIRWAQRSNAQEPEKNKLWITVAVPNLIEYKVTATEDHFSFVGKDAERSYDVEFDFYEEIDPSFTRELKTSQHVFVELRKKVTASEYWPRLFKDSVRRPFIRTDFDRWVDEDEQDEAPEEDPLGGMGGMGAGGMPGMGGAGGMDIASMLQGMGGGPAGGDGPGGFDMSQLDALKAMSTQGNAGSLEGDDDDEENDETATNLGEAAE